MVDDSARALTTQDGRHLAYLEVGDPHGPLVIHNHGGPSSRLEARLLADAAAKNRLRLVCVDRPGMGQSSPQKARTYAGWADDLVTIADALGYQEFGVTGWSEGGPWALAAAAYIDPAPPSPRQQHRAGKLRRIRGQLGGAIPFEDRRARRIAGAAVQTRLPPDVRRHSALSAKRFRDSFVKQMRNTVNDYDRQILLRPEIAKGFGDSCAECFAHGSDGLVRDAELLYRRWAFDVKADRAARPPVAGTGRSPCAGPHQQGGGRRDARCGVASRRWRRSFRGRRRRREIFAIAAKELGAP